MVQANPRETLAPGVDDFAGAGMAPMIRALGAAPDAGSRAMA